MIDHDGPDGGAVGACTELRRLHGADNLPIAMVTALDPRLVALGTESCPDAILTKPCLPDPLIPVLNLLLQRPRQVIISGSYAATPASLPRGPLITVRCPLCATSGALLGAGGSVLCQECGPGEAPARAQFVDAR